MNYKICAITTISKTMDWFVVDTMRYLSKNGFDVTLICDMDKGFIDRNKDYANTIPLTMERGINFGDAIRIIHSLYKIFKKEKYDIIQYATPNAALYASVAAFFAGIPIRLYTQWGIRYVGFSGIKRVFFKCIEKFTCMLSTQIEPDSFGNLNLAYSEGLYSKKKSCVIWNGSACGVNLKKFDVSNKEQWRSEIRKKYNIDEQALVFGFVGRLDRDKGINELFEAYQSILSEYSNTYLMIVGREDKINTLENNLYQWSKIEKTVIYCGETFEVEKYLSALDIFVLPSYREGFGNSVIEASAMELPVIITDIAGPTEAMINKETGLVVKKADVESLKKAMVELLTNANMRQEMGIKGLSFVNTNFDSNKLMKYILNDRHRLIENSAVQ